MGIRRNPYPLRLDEGVREEVEVVAMANDRSLNWQLNELVKIGLMQVMTGQERKQNAAN